MTTSARSFAPSLASLAHMRVKGHDGDAWMVADDDGARRVRRARSCLIEPAIGDLVLVSHGADGSAFILAVLEGSSDDIELVATGDLRLAAGRRLVLAAPELAADLGAATVTVDRLRLAARMVDAAMDSAKLVGERLHLMAADVLADLGRSVRRVAGLDQTSAGIIDQRAEDTLSLHARVASITADRDVRIDGDQIHMG
jgi:hypothetical protein